MSTVRELITELTGTSEYAEVLSDETELAASGIDSADLVRLVLLMEQRMGVEITAQDMEKLSTIADYERFLGDRAGSAPQSDGA